MSVVCHELVYFQELTWLVSVPEHLKTHSHSLTKKRSKNMNLLKTLTASN